MKTMNTGSRVWPCLALSLGFLGAVCSASPAQAKASRQPPACDIATAQQLVSGATITAAAMQHTTDGATAYCRVDGYVATQGPGPNANRVNFMVSLPEGFKGRYYYIGLGGAAGYVPSPPDVLLSQGFAVAGSDAGTQTFVLDWTFAIDRTKAFDYAQRGVHVSSVATQEITRGYYQLKSSQLKNKSKKLYRYIDGCSGGGRMGNVEAIVHPDDYDGTILGAPGINTGNVLLFGKIAQFLIQHPEAWISPAQFAQLEQAIVASFDRADGAADGVVSRVINAGIDPAALGIFTEPQLQTLQMIREGIDLGGVKYPGFPLANPIGWSSFLVGNTPPPWSMNPADLDFPPAGFMVFESQSRGLFGLTYNFVEAMDFNSAADVSHWAQTYEDVFIESGTADPADLLGYLKGGGKIVMWHGIADNAISVNDSIRYYNQLAQARGGLAGTQQSARLFLAPGVLHCAGGIGPQDTPTQALDAIVRWVEKGVAPQSLVVNRAPSATLPARSFRLCPYPQRALFKGGLENPKGLDVNDAANWRCALPYHH